MGNPRGLAMTYCLPPSIPAGQESDIAQARGFSFMAKPPAFQFYAKDWLADTAHLTLEEQGAYIRLLAHQWVQGALPRLHADRARLLRVNSATWRRIWGRLAHHFPRGKNPRLEAIRRAMEAYHQHQVVAGQRGAARRWRSDPIVRPITSLMTQPIADDSSAFASSSERIDLRAHAPNDNPPARHKLIRVPDGRGGEMQAVTTADDPRPGIPW